MGIRASGFDDSIYYITVLTSSKRDIALYLAVHFFYLGAWLFQTDADDVRVTWTIRLFPYTDFLDPFLKEWGGVLFLVTSIATFVCYLIILTPLQKGNLFTTEITEITETKDNFIFH